MMGSSNKPRILGSKICEPVLPKTCEKKQISKERSSVSKLKSAAFFHMGFIVIFLTHFAH